MTLSPSKAYSIHPAYESPKGSSVKICPSSYIVIDTETTGFSPSDDEIIEVSAIKVENGTVVDTFDSLVHSDRKISFGAANVNHITEEMLENSGFEPVEVFSALEIFIEDYVLVGHNIAGFDIKMLNNAFCKYLGHPISNNYFDTLIFARNTVYDTKNHKLPTLLEKFKIKNENPHRAYGDAKATYKLLLALITYKPELPKAKPEQRKVKIEITSDCKELKGKKIRFKTKFKSFDTDELISIADALGFEISNALTTNVDYLVVNNKAHAEILSLLQMASIDPDSTAEWKLKAVDKIKTGRVTLLAESDFVTLIQGETNLIDETKSSQAEIVVPSSAITGKHFVFTGKLTIDRKSAEKIVKDLGGKTSKSVSKNTNYLIIGGYDSFNSVKGDLSEKHRKAIELQRNGHDINILNESDFLKLIPENFR